MVGIREDGVKIERGPLFLSHTPTLTFRQQRLDGFHLHRQATATVQVIAPLFEVPLSTLNPQLFGEQGLAVGQMLYTLY